MMLAFEIDIQIVKWVMTALGKPLGPIAPPPAEAMLPGAAWRPDAPGWDAPPPAPPAPRRPPPSGKAAERTTRPAGWERRRPGRGDQAPAHRGIPGLARPRRAPAA